jgi:hypothetical protein
MGKNAGIRIEDSSIPPRNTIDSFGISNVIATEYCMRCGCVSESRINYLDDSWTEWRVAGALFEIL